MFGIMEALLSFIRRQVGLRTDPASATGSLHSKVKDIQSRGVVLSSVYASDTIRASSNGITLGTVSALSAEKLKEFRIFASGVVRVTFTIARTGSRTVYAQVYRNGEPLGNEFSSISSATTCTQDLFFGVGDSIEIWGRVSATGEQIQVYDAKICFDFNPTTVSVFVSRE